MDNFSLVVQATYNSVEYSLYKNHTPGDHHTLIKTAVCTDLMYNLCTLLEEQKITWNTINHIIINQGPAPFTTLRGLIATVNGISFAQKIPLIAVDGLEAFTTEISASYSSFLILLNAFAGDFYYSFKHHSTALKGCGNFLKIKEIIDNHTLNEPLVITGNGLSLLQEQLEKEYGTKIMCDPTHDYVKLTTIASEGFKIIQQKPVTTFYVSPLYLKTLTYQPSCLV